MTPSVNRNGMVLFKKFFKDYIMEEGLGSAVRPPFPLDLGDPLDPVKRSGRLVFAVIYSLFARLLGNIINRSLNETPIILWRLNMGKTQRKNYPAGVLGILLNMYIHICICVYVCYAHLESPICIYMYVICTYW